MQDKTVYEEITRALDTMQKYFGAEVFAQPGRFMAGINDVVPTDAKTVKHLLRIAICDLHAYSRLEQALAAASAANTSVANTSVADNFTAKHLATEMAEHYMVPPEVCERVIECIAVFAGFKPSPQPAVQPKPAPAAAKPVPTTAKPTPLNPISIKLAPLKPIPIKPTPLKPVAIKIPKMPVRSAPGKLSPKPSRDTNFAAVSAPKPAAGYKIGTITRFGGRDWRVLDVQAGKALLLSERIIDTKWYHDRNINTDWAGCSMRQYLNGAFYKSFRHDEQFRMAKTNLQNERNPWFGTKAAAGTADRIFLLSIAEVLKYFGDSGQIRKRPPNAGHIDDQFNKARIAPDSGGTPAWWWLRSPGYIPNRTAFIAANGALYIYGSLVRGDSGGGGGIRPAVWLEV